MINLRNYNDALFRIDEVLRDKMSEWLKFDERFFYAQNDFNRAFLAFMFDVEPKSINLEDTKELLIEPIKTYFDEGTYLNLKKALKSFYPSSNVTEWHSYGGEPYHFKLELEASRKGISRESLAKTDEIVQTFKNVRSVYDGASVKIATKANLCAASYATQGESIEVMPFVLREISAEAMSHVANAFKQDEIIDIKLNLIGAIR